MTSVWVDDPFDARRVLGAPGLLGTFNEAGVTLAGEVHVAARLGELCGERDEAVLLAVALAVRAPRLGHVFVDLADAASSTTVELETPVDMAALPWPGEDWAARVAASALVAVGEEDEQPRPLRLVGTRLYLDRYWREERRIAEDLRTLRGPVGAVDEDVLSDGVARLLPDADEWQRLAAGTAVRERFSVIAGGPGTGKTTTVARIVALLLEQGGDPLIALAAPTGKAAARLEEAVHAAAAEMDVSDDVRARLTEVSASTLHRLLGRRPGSESRFKHDRGNRLPYDVVIVDETSMVSLSLMGRLVEAVRPDARLVLVGDPGQLTSVEAGAVLRDVVGPGEPPVVVLQRVHRFGEETAIADLARAIDAQDADAAIDVLRRGAPDVVWVETQAEAPGDAGLASVRDAAVASARAVHVAAAGGDAAGALRALSGFRLLCAHRRGGYGAAAWSQVVERWLAAAIDDLSLDAAWYVGRPLLVTENDYGLRLFNGDTGVVVAAEDDRVVAAFERAGEVALVSTMRLGAVDTVHAMTVHKAQGSQFATAAVLLPPADSPLLTKELLYTAVTRASERMILVATEDAVRAAIARPAARASGLRERLWDV